jgi:hypothetical protein
VNADDCEAEATTESGDEPGAEVEYLGAATDEAYAHLVDLPPTQIDTRRLELDAPTSTKLAEATPSTFAFHVQGAQGAVVETQGSPSWQRWARTSWRQVVRFATPVGVAHAHGVPYNGDAFLLEFRANDGSSLARVFTSEGSFAPSVAQWAEWASASQPIGLRIVWGSFEENELIEDGGPFVGLDFEFSIQ